MLDSQWASPLASYVLGLWMLCLVMLMMLFLTLLESACWKFFCYSLMYYFENLPFIGRWWNYDTRTIWNRMSQKGLSIITFCIICLEIVLTSVSRFKLSDFVLQVRLFANAHTCFWIMKRAILVSWPFNFVQRSACGDTNCMFSVALLFDSLLAKILYVYYSWSTSKPSCYISP